MAGLNRRMPKRKTVKSKKIAGRFCFSRNPSGTLFPNANPETRVNWRLSVFDVRATDSIQINSDTQTIVLGFKVYSRTPEIVQGGIKNVTGTHSRVGERAMASKFAERTCFGAEHLDKRGPCRVLGGHEFTRAANRQFFDLGFSPEVWVLWRARNMRIFCEPYNAICA